MQRSTDALTPYLESPPSKLDELLLRVLVLYLFGDQLEPWTVGRHSTGTLVSHPAMGDIQRTQDVYKAPFFLLALTKRRSARKKR